MGAVTVTVRNKDRLYAKLRRLAPAAEAALVTVNGEAAAEMVRLAQSYAPVKSGKLRDSIVATPPGGSPPAHGQGATIVPPGAFMVTAGNTAVRYAHLVEFGTRQHVAGGRFAGAEHPRLHEELVHQGGLAMVDVGDDADIAERHSGWDCTLSRVFWEDKTVSRSPK
jgi:hypothetical protein